MDNERRYKRLIIPYQTLINILHGTVELCDFVLPDDARVVHVQDDFQMAGIGLIIESASYEPVGLGYAVPNVHSFAMRIRRKEGTDGAN
jgi:hypothetical protein